MTSPLPPVALQGRVRSVMGRQMLALDGVRGLAILLVLAHNLEVLAGRQTPVGQAIVLFDGMGWVGVQLFFVLSGFLITGILLDTRDSDNYYGAFLGRRVLRIFPLYYGTLLVAFVVLPLVGAPHPPPDGQVWLWTYTVNWVEPFGYGNPELPHFWSLAVEEQFYLAWPLVVRALSPRRLVILCLGLSVVAFATRVGMRLHGFGPQAVYEWTICRMDALALGAAVAAVLRLPHAAKVVARWNRGTVWAALSLGLVGFLITRGDPRTTLMSQTIGYSILAITFAVFVCAAVIAEAHGRGVLYRVLAWRPLRAFGLYSYGIYIFHMPIHRGIGLPLLRRWLPEDASIGAKINIAYFVVITAVTFAAAAASYHLFERRFLGLKRYFTPSRTRSS